MGSSQLKENEFGIKRTLCLVCAGGSVGGLKISVNSRQSVPLGEDLETFAGWMERVSFENAYSSVFKASIF